MVIGVALLVLVAVFFVIKLTAVYFIQWVVYTFLAPKNMFWTFVNEGTAKIIVHGGEFHKIIINWQGYSLDAEWNVVKVDEESGQHVFGGARHIGFYPFYKVYGYRLRWSSPHTNGIIVDHDEELEQVLLKDHIYAVQVQGAEDRMKVPLDFTLLVTLSVVNPYKFAFRVHDSFEVVLNRIKALFRDYVGETTYHELLTAETNTVTSTVWSKLLERQLIQEFEKEYGIKIKEQGIEIREIDPPPTYQAAATKKQDAEWEAERIVVLADAEKQRLEMIYRAIHDFGDTGSLIRALEAMEKSPLAASMVVQSIPGLQDLLHGVLGKQPENATLQEIRGVLRDLQAAVDEIRANQQP